MHELTSRQAYALAHPLDYAATHPDELAEFRRHREHRRGLLTTILAVDR